jgi:hypothetical protein
MGGAVDQVAAERMQRIMDRKYQTNRDNCKSKLAYELFLPGDVNYGTVFMCFESVTGIQGYILYHCL